MLIARIRRILIGVSTLALSTAALVAVSTSAAQSDEPIPEGDVPQALYNFVASPDQVAGANVWSCQTTDEHPNPVVLLPGTFFNVGANFVKAAPRLANNGYCVFATNYGMTAASLGRVGGLGPIKDSAQELAAFVDRVRAATGAEQVDIVGHSQGGNVPLWFIKKLGGADEVAHYVGWAPSSHGTTLDGIATLADTLGLLGFVTGVSEVGQFPGVLDQLGSSEYNRQLWADGDTVPDGPAYTVIATKYDRVVTPYESQFLNGSDVNNVVLQDKCPTDIAGHVGLFDDDPTLQLTMNALADGPADFQPVCEGFGLPFA